MDKYEVYFREGVNEYFKMEILFATCNINFKFAGVGLGNIKTMIEDYRSGFNHLLHFVPSRQKLSNLGDALYISRQRLAEIITKNDEVIWSRFEGDEKEKIIINNYLLVAKTK